MKKRKINIVDIAVILVVLALIAGGIYKFGVINKENKIATDATENKEYVVLVKGVRQPTIDALHEGDEFFDKVTGTAMGKVVGIKTEPFETMILKSDGEYKKADKIGYYNLYVTLEGPVLEKTNGYFVGGVVELKRNSTLEISSKYISTGFKVFDLDF